MTSPSIRQSPATISNQSHNTAQPLSAADDSCTEHEHSWDAVQLVGNGSYQPRDDRSQLVTSTNPSSASPQAAAETARHTAALAVLLSGRPSRAETPHVPSPTAAAVGGSAAAEHTVAMINDGAHGADRPKMLASAGASRPPGGVGAKRMSLTAMGILAPTAALLPGSPLADPATAVLSATHNGSSSAAASSSGGLSRQNTAKLASIMGSTAGLSALHTVSAADTIERTNSSMTSAGSNWQHQQQRQHLALQQQQQAASAYRFDASTVGKPGSASHSHNDSSDASSSQQLQAGVRGSSAFKAPSRSQASRVGHLCLTLEQDLPGPGQFQPQHAAIDKHVYQVKIVEGQARKHRSAHRQASAQVAHQPLIEAPSPSKQQQLEQQQDPVPDNPGHRVSIATDAARRMSAYTDTPRSAADEAADSTPRKATEQPARQHQPRGTSAFKAVSRDRRAATAAAATVGAGCYFQEGYDYLVRPSSKGPVAHFDKQTHRRPPSAVAAALGPGSYFRRGQMPLSLTGKAVAAGHPGGVAVPNFARTTSRPDSSTPHVSTGAAGSSSTVCSQRQSTGSPGEPGIWGWGLSEYNSAMQQAPSANGSVAAAIVGTNLSSSPGDVHSQVAAACTAAASFSPSRPSSAALDYARSQRATSLVTAPPAEANWPADGVPCGSRDQPAPQQLRPQSVGPHQSVRHKPSSTRPRPASAGALLVHHTAAAAAAKAAHFSSRPTSSVLGPQAVARHGTDAAGGSNADAADGPTGPSDGVMGLAALQQYSSTGLAARVKGGYISQTSRSAAPPVSEGAEFVYEPKPEVQGHMHRSPGWSLPPNRIATSKKWAQMAARAALQ